MQQNTERKLFLNLFYNHLDILIDSLYNNGILFYSFTIKIPFLEKNDPKMWYYTHLHLEGWLSTFRTEIEMLEFCYFSTLIDTNNLVVQKLNKGISLFKGIIGVRSLMGKTNMHLNQIRKIFTIWKGINFY